MLSMLALAATLVAASPDNADKCKYLEQLSREYAGQTLSAYEQAVKRRMVAWYRANCKKSG